MFTKLLPGRSRYGGVREEVDSGKLEITASSDDKGGEYGLEANPLLLRA
jgi:hypothetical protein